MLNTVNHAYVDGSYSSGDDDSVAGAGWGIVLLLPGQPARRIGGRIESGLPETLTGVEDNNAAELRAVLEALRHAPPGEALTVHSDNTSTLRSVRLGSLSVPQAELAAAIRQEAALRGTALHLARESRERRHMRAAHDLANEARRSAPGAPLSCDGPTQITAEALIVQTPWRAEAVVTLRRPGERVRLELPLDPAAPLPPSAQALLGAAGLAQAGEVLLVRRVTVLAQAIWEKPLRALEGEARSAVQAARAHAEELGVTVLFGP
ncbi:ribonuclease H [Deinococcus radiomollis]|uniref:ribonuclease HI n=1 Tax=Deinococcus radiomollis TaxID=468916 RepID=UPI003892BEC9